MERDKCMGELKNIKHNQQEKLPQEERGRA
jgi:hypothetical protein